MRINIDKNVWRKHALKGASISQQQAWRVLHTIWRDEEARVPYQYLTAIDRRFAQAMILTAAETTARLGLVTEISKIFIEPTFTINKDGMKSVGKEVMKYLTQDNSLKKAMTSDNAVLAIQVLRAQKDTAWRQRCNSRNSAGNDDGVEELLFNSAGIGM